MAKVSIIGTGTWGIALGMVLAQNGHEVTAWSALPKEIEALRESYTCKNLPGVEIPRSIVFTADLRRHVLIRRCLFCQFLRYLPEE